MKRFLSLLTSLMLLLGSLPVAAWADTYTYPEITITIPPSDMAQLELEFRAWAAELVADYYYGTYHASEDSLGRTPPQPPYAEYYRMANTKVEFDAYYLDDTSVVYNVHRNGELEEEKRVAMNMWVLNETLKDAMVINHDQIMKDYANLHKSEREYLMYDISSGKMVKNEALEAIDEMESDLALMATIDMLTSIAVTGAEGYLELQLQKAKTGDAPSLSELIDGLGDAIKDIIHQCTEIAENNAQIAAQNTIRQMLITDMANQLAYMNERSVMFLHHAYTGSLSYQRDYNNALDNFVAMFDPDENAELDNMIGNHASSLVSVTTAFNNAGLVELETIDLETALVLGIIEALKEVFKTLLEAWIAPLESTKISNSEISMGDIASCICDILTETMDEAFDSALDEIYTEYFNGTPMNTDICVNILGSKIADAFTGETLRENIASNAVELAGLSWAGEISFSNPYLSGLCKYFLLVLSDSEGAATDQAMKRLMGIDSTASADDVLEYISKALKPIGDSVDDQFMTESEYQELLDDYKNKTANQKSREARLRDKSQNYTNQQYLNGEKGQHLQRRINEEKAELDELHSKLKSKQLEAWIDLADEIVAAGIDCAEAVDSWFAAANNEGGMSLLAGCIASTKDLCYFSSAEARLFIKLSIVDPKTDRQFLINNQGEQIYVPASYLNDYQVVVYTISDPTYIPLEQLTDLVSTIHTKVKYDTTGTLLYYDLAFNTYVMGDYESWGGLSSADFLTYTREHHTNVHGLPGILSEAASAHLYNQVVTFYDTHFQDTYDPAWDVFFEEANGA